MAAIGTLLDSLHTSGFSRVAALQNRKRPKGVAGAAVCPEHTRIEESQ